jgi:hypothetical protein
MANQLFNHLKSGLKKANSAPPQYSTLVMGFTKEQMFKMDLKRPRLVWYDAVSKRFYDQGDSTKIKKSDYSKINALNFNSDKPIVLEYYIPINNTIINESSRPLD